MKPVIYAVSVFLTLSFASSAVLAYSGSECEVNDCSSNKPEKAKAKKDQAKPASLKEQAKPASLKEQAKDQAKDKAKEKARAKVSEKVPAELQGINGLLK